MLTSGEGVVSSPTTSFGREKTTHTHDQVGGSGLSLNHVGGVQVAHDDAGVGVLILDLVSRLRIPHKQAVLEVGMGLVQGVEDVAANVA